jgi:T-complex protein 1 subunit zeta
MFMVWEQFLDSFKQSSTSDRATLINVANTSLATKVNGQLAKKLAADIVDAVTAIRPAKKGWLNDFEH